MEGGGGQNVFWKGNCWFVCWAHLAHVWAGREGWGHQGRRLNGRGRTDQVLSLHVKEQRSKCHHTRGRVSRAHARVGREANAQRAVSSCRRLRDLSPHSKRRTTVGTRARAGRVGGARAHPSETDQSTNRRIDRGPPPRAPPGTGTRGHVGQQGHEEESKTHEPKARLEKLPPQLLHGPPVGAVGGWVGGGRVGVPQGLLACCRVAWARRANGSRAKGGVGRGQMLAYRQFRFVCE
jgi:hypothetical protein